MKESGICGYLLRSPIRKNRPLRLSLLRISAGISPLSFFGLVFFVEEHRFFRFPFRFTAGKDAPLFSVLAFFGGDALLSYNMQKNFVFEQKKSTEFLQWTSVDNVDNYALFYYCFSTLKRISKRVSGTAICTTCFVDFQEHKIFQQ